MNELAFQDRIKNNRCWGCGSLNDHGLQLKSHWEDEVSVCSWTPDPMFMAGPAHILYGGTIASLIDCHCVCTAIARGYESAGRPVGEGEAIWYATGTLNVRYLSPTPIAETVTLRARITEETPTRTNLTCTVSSGGLERVTAQVVAVRVTTGWFD